MTARQLSKPNPRMEYEDELGEGTGDEGIQRNRNACSQRRQRVWDVTERGRD